MLQSDKRSERRFGCLLWSMICKVLQSEEQFENHPSLGAQLFHVDCDGICRFPVYGQHNVDFATPSSGARNPDVALIQSDKIFRSPGKQDFGNNPANRHSRRSQTAAESPAASIGNQKDLIGFQAKINRHMNNAVLRYVKP